MNASIERTAILFTHESYVKNLIKKSQRPYLQVLIDSSFLKHVRHPHQNGRNRSCATAKTTRSSPGTRIPTDRDPLLSVSCACSRRSAALLVRKSRIQMRENSALSNRDRTFLGYRSPKDRHLPSINKNCRRGWGWAMGAANPIRIDLASSPPCEAFRPRFIPPAGNRAPADQTSPLEYERPRSGSIIAFICAAALVGFATNLSMHLLNLRMQYLGVSGFGIGLSVAIQALGIIIAAPLTKHVISFAGVRQTLLIGALLSSVALVTFAFATDLFIWNAMRLMFATGLALLFTASESLVISRADATNRGRVVAWYATALATGTAAGPLLVTVVGIQGSAPLVWSSLLSFVTRLLRPFASRRSPSCPPSSSA